MDLERPDITRARKEGYPDGTGKPRYKHTNNDYNTNKFIRIYERKRKEGRNPVDAYVYASGKLAFDYDANKYMHQDLYFHFTKDDADDFIKDAEEYLNE